ncbi:MAG TPA: GNAT family N-acetyltransferase [Chloroflexota bacterium]|nr:GNAT family N-acetyltransferase [Chloroflexota bacterium]
MADIRRAIPEDIDTLVQFRCRLMEEIGHLPPDADVTELAEATEQYLTDHMLDQTFIAWVAEQEGRIIGTGGLVFLERPPSPDNLAGLEAYIMNMYTVPEWRGQGVATAILRTMVDHVKASPARRIWLHATEAGAPLYERYGFTCRTNVMEMMW